MTHEWHDSYRHQKTPAHHLDPRSKLFVGLLFIGVVLSTSHFSRIQAAGYPLLIVLAAGLSGISLRPLLMRLATLTPFVALMLFSMLFSQLSWARLCNVLEKALLSLAVVTLIAMTTPFPDLLRAFQMMQVSKLLVLLLAFLYRYGTVLGEEALQMERAWISRYFGRLPLRQWSHFGNIVAALFVRSYERAERVFAAMQSRGFSSDAPLAAVLHFGLWDTVFVMGSSVLLLGVRCGLS